MEGSGARPTTSIALSADSRTFYYCTNANDIERRHIWAVPVRGGTPVQITTGEVETYPAPLASGRYLATLSAGWHLPQSVGIWKLSEAPSSQTIIFPKTRPPVRVWLGEYPRRRTRLLDDSAMQRLPDGRWQVEWQTERPRLHERYALKWEW